MRFRAAYFCDAAAVREGLLHVIGAGITRFSRSELPATCDVTYAAMLEVSPMETQQVFVIEIKVEYDDGTPVGEPAVAFGTGLVVPAFSGAPSSVPIVIDMRDMVLTKYGRLYVDLSINGERLDRLEALVDKGDMLAPPDVRAAAAATEG